MKVRNWEKFQHYKDRKPQWIKLHSDLLDNRSFAMLSVEVRAALPLIWIVASENERGEVPDCETLAFRLRLTVDAVESIVNELVDADFVSDESEGEEREKWASRHIPAKLKAEVFARDGGRCVNCQSDQNIEYDHIIPISRGGKSVDGNIQLLCRRCNRSKRTKISVERLATQSPAVSDSSRSLEKRKEREETETETERVSDAQSREVDEIRADHALEEQRLTANLIAIRDAGEDVQAALDSIADKGRKPFSAYGWLRNGRSGVPETRAGVTVLRLLNAALEARQRGAGKKRKGAAPAWDRGEASYSEAEVTAWDERLGPRPVMERTA